MYKIEKEIFNIINEIKIKSMLHLFTVSSTTNKLNLKYCMHYYNYKNNKIF